MPHVLVAFGLGAAEIAIIVFVVLLVFGPSKLPQLGEGIGKMLRGFKKEMKSIEEDEHEAQARPAPIDAASEAAATSGDKKIAS
jgi:sec-independent protein translocase protein TatA